MIVFILQIVNGRFHLSTQGRKYTSALTPMALAKMFQRGGYDRHNRDHILTKGSSIDFPEDDGAPDGFDAYAVIKAAFDLDPS